jgi:hypothetical protein
MLEFIHQFMPIFIPIFGIVLGIVIAKSLIGSIDAATRNEVAKQTPTQLDDELFKIEKSKRQYDEWINGDAGDEKPKHHSEPAYILGDDGELLEVIDEKPKRHS